jgi:hypothetical protein
MDDSTPQEQDQFDQQYAWYETREVKADRRIPLPANVQASLQNNSYPAGPAIAWGYSESADWMVLSRDPLKKEDYTSVDFNKIQNPEASSTYIRAPDKLPDQFLDIFYEGKSLVYLATTEMIDENPSSWLVEKRKLMSLLPGAGDESEIVEPLRNQNPGFLPDI